METFAASSPKFFLDSLSDRLHPSTTRDAAAASLILTTPTDIRFLGRSLKKDHHHHHAVSPSFSSLSVSLLHRKTLLPLSYSTDLSEAQTCAGDEGIQTEDTTHSKTVHVKFQLRRECSFGEQFFIVGDDPMFGLWDPLNAVPLNWSEEHVWAVEMDIPCDKVMKYKFILKGNEDTILWQPGPDRILQTWETSKTITVCDDWDNAELQTIMEEEPVIHHQLTESIQDSQVLIATESLLETSGDPESSLETSGDPESYLNKEITSKNGYSQPTKTMLAEKPIAAVTKNITGQNGEKEVEAIGFLGAKFTPYTDEVTPSLGIILDYPKSGRSSSSEINLDSGAAVPVLVPGLTPMPTEETEEESVSKADERIHTDSSLNAPEVTTLGIILDYPKSGRSSSSEINLDSGAAVPVLVPGLTPMPTEETEEESVSKADERIHTDSSLNAPDPEPNLKEEPDIDLLIPKEETEKWLTGKLEMQEKGYVQLQKTQLFEVKDQPNNKGVEDGVLKKDFQWGRRTLQQFLMNLGWRSNYQKEDMY